MSENENPKTPGKDWDALATSETENAASEPEQVEEDAAPQGILEHPDYRALEEKLTETEQLVHEHRDKALRAMSDSENLRRRMERELENAHKYSIEKLAKELLPVIDSLEHALAATDADDTNQQGIREGLEMTLSMFLTSIEKFSIQSINPEGEPFDSDQHEAMSMQEDPNVAPNTVIAVFQKGYKLYDRVIRPARVIVSKGTHKKIDEKA